MNAIDEKNLIKIAVMYYDEGMTQAQIAKEMNVSRSLISKYLNDARQQGLIEVFINSKSLYATKLERQLEKKYKLKNAVVVDTYNLNNYDEEKAVSHVAAKYLQNFILNNEINSIGFSWGKTLRNMVDHFEYTNFPNCNIVPLIGGMGNNHVEIHSNQLVFDFTKKIRGSAEYLYAPAIVDNEQIKKELYDNKIIHQTLLSGYNVELAIVGLATPYKNSTMIEIGYLNQQDLEELKRLSVVGDINSRFFDESGKEVSCEINNHVIGLTLSDLKVIPNVLGIAYGKYKIPVVRVALENHLINLLVTTDTIANKLINS